MGRRSFGLRGMKMGLQDGGSKAGRLHEWERCCGTEWNEIAPSRLRDGPEGCARRRAARCRLPVGHGGHGAKSHFKWDLTQRRKGAKEGLAYALVIFAPLRLCVSLIRTGASRFDDDGDKNVAAPCRTDARTGIFENEAFNRALRAGFWMADWKSAVCCAPPRAPFGSIPQAGWSYLVPLGSATALTFRPAPDIFGA